MRKVFYAFALLLPIAALVGAITLGVQQFTRTKAAGVKPAVVVCLPTGFIRDGMNLTAAVIPTSATPNVSGTVDATGCNIGVYYTALVLKVLSVQKSLVPITLVWSTMVAS